MNRYQNVFMFCRCTAFSFMSAKTHGVLLNCASFTANNRRNKGCKQGFFLRFLQSLSKCALKKYENPDVSRVIPLPQWFKALHAQ